MSLVFSIPGKTFVAGEYSVLKGGAALVAATEPPFQVFVERGAGALSNIHENSPAGIFFHKNWDFFKNFSIRFHDPLGLGGLGASTAQFLGLYAFFEWKENCEIETEKYIDRHQMLKTYTECAWQGEGHPPSGVDLIGQERGHLTLFDKSAGRMSTHSWPFSHLKFHIVHTGVKLATHEHLKALADFDETAMKRAFTKIQKSLGGAEAELQNFSLEERERFFVEGINDYAGALAEQSLTAAHSLALLEEIRSLSGVLAAKACGAMGADVLFVVTAKEDSMASDEELKKYLARKNLRLVATEKSLGEGLQMRVLQGDLF